MASAPKIHEELIHGVTSTTLTSHGDRRGSLTEFFRTNWENRYYPVQWNMTTSSPLVLRGVHVHLTHWDYLVLAHGRMQLGLCDLRRNSPTFMKSCIAELDAGNKVGWSIPPGVAHGFYFPIDTILIYGVSAYWSVKDEFGCRWDDPDLGLGWDVSDPILSPHDAAAPSLSILMQTVDAFDFPLERG